MIETIVFLGFLNALTKLYPIIRALFLSSTFDLFPIQTYIWWSRSRMKELCVSKYEVSKGLSKIGVVFNFPVSLDTLKN